MIENETTLVRPDLGALQEDFNWCVNRSGSNIFTRQRLNYNTRYCLWPNQSSDGKRWKAADGSREVWPWPGASDARVHLVDTYVLEDVALLKSAWRRNRIQVTGTESGDTEFATRMTQLLRWLKYTQMREAPREMKLAANWALEYGSCVMGVFWDRREQLGYEEFDMESLVGQAMDAQMALSNGQLPPGVPPEMAQEVILLAQAVMDPAQEDIAAQLLAKRYPKAKAASVKRAVRQLREKGAAKLVNPYVRSERPCLVALLPNDEIFIAPEATDPQESRVFHRREVLTEATLRERVQTHEWDPEFVEEVIQSQGGRISTTTIGYAYRAKALTGTNVASTDLKHLFEVVHTMQRHPDEEGVPGIYYTVWHPGLCTRSTRRKREELYGWHGLLGYHHGDYPYVLMERENRSRLLDQSRGYGEVAATWQSQLKAEWDSRVDRASISTLPPSFYPPGEPPAEWGPGAQVSTNRPDSYGFMAAPKWDPGSKEIELSIRAHSDRYFGRVLADQSNIVQAQALQQGLVDDWLEFWQRIDTQTLQLMQQFGPEELYFRVVGSEKARPLRATRDEIQGQFDVSITYNVRGQYPEEQTAMLGVVEKALTWDMAGLIDRSELLSFAFSMVDPNLAERVLRPANEASMAEVEDEAQAFAKISSGQDVPVKPGQAYELRLKYLEEMLKQNPTAQQRAKEDPHFAELVKKRVQRLQHQLEQFGVNAEIGRQGA